MLDHALLEVIGIKTFFYRVIWYQMKISFDHTFKLVSRQKNDRQLLLTEGWKLSESGTAAL